MDVQVLGRALVLPGIQSLENRKDRKPYSVVML